MIPTTTLDLFAGIPVADFPVALDWYERLLGFPPTMFPDEGEAVWEVAEQRYLYIVLLPERAGHARLTFFVANLDALVTGIAGRGIEPVLHETYSNGVRKITYRDGDGNEIGLGGATM